MKISPLEIRQKSFEKNFRGYDKDEVDAFLLSLSQEWERVMDDAKELKIRFQAAEKEVQKLREVESTLYKTLKTAEDTGANIVEQANKSAELLVKESQMNAESTMNEARTKARNMVEDAEEKVKNALFNAQNKLNDLVMEIKSLENQKQNVVHDLKQIANDVLDKANRISAPVQLPDFSKMLAKEDMPIRNTYQEPQKPIVAKEEPTHEEIPARATEASKAESFFDQI